MTFFKTTLGAICAISTFASAANADGHTGGPTVISDLISIPEVGPDAITLGLMGGLLLLASTSSTSATTN